MLLMLLMRWQRPLFLTLLPLLCAVAAAGDVRRALELLRRGVEIARQQQLTAAAVAAKAAGDSSAAAALPRQQPAVVKWQGGQPALLRRMQVQQAQQEMFGALHLQLLRSRSTWEKILLVAVVVEARATGRTAVVIQVTCREGRGGWE